MNLILMGLATAFWMLNAYVALKYHRKSIKALEESTQYYNDAKDVWTYDAECLQQTRELWDRMVDLQGDES